MLGCRRWKSSATIFDAKPGKRTAYARGSREHPYKTQRLFAPAAAGFDAHHNEVASGAFQEFPTFGDFLLPDSSEHSSVDIGCIGPRLSLGCQDGSLGDVHRHVTDFWLRVDEYLQVFFHLQMLSVDQLV